MSWRRDLAASGRLLVVLALICGGLYSLLVAAAAQGLFGWQAQGSLVRRGGVVVASQLVGQAWTGPGWFWGRPSATVAAAGRPDPYNADLSGASNLAPDNPALLGQVGAALAAYAAVGPGQVPPSQVESSASGLDPDITVRAALLQVPRVAAARHLPAGQVTTLVRREARGRWLGLFGHPHVNVLELNLALERLDSGH